jgi:hypothetical protein
MAKVINKQDISVDDVFGLIRESAKSTKIETDALMRDLEAIIPLTQKILSGKGADVKGIEAQLKAIEKLNVATARAAKLQEQSIKEKIALDKLAGDESRKNAVNEQRVAQAKIKTENDKRKSQEQSTRSTERESRAQQKANSFYSTVERNLGNLSKAYRDLSLRKELSNDLSKLEEIRLEALYKATNHYRSALLKVDASQQLHHRNVGNYKSGFDGLGHSINQLTREAPAFANSMQTGFMAISNNIPMMFDEIKRINVINDELRKNGQQTTSVFKKLGSAIFSFQTALSLGVTLLTIYGAKIADAASQFFKGAEAIDKMAFANEDFKQSLDSSLSSISDEIALLDVLFDVAQDETKSKKERVLAIKEINKISPEYLGNIKLETINQKESTKAVNDYINSLKKKSIAQAVLAAKQGAINKIIAAEIQDTEKTKSDIIFSGAAAFEALKFSLFGATKIDATGLAKLGAPISAAKNEADRLNKALDKVIAKYGLTTKDFIDINGGGSGGSGSNSVNTNKFNGIEAEYALRKKLILETADTERGQLQELASLDEWRLNKKIELEKQTKGTILDITNLQIELIQLQNKEVEAKREMLSLVNKEIEALYEKKKIVDVMNNPKELEKVLELENDRAKATERIAVMQAEINVIEARKGGNNREVKKAEKELIEAKIKQIKLELELAKRKSESPIETAELEKQAELEIAKLTAIDGQVNKSKELAKISQDALKAIEDMLTGTIQNQINDIDRQIAIVNRQYDIVQQKAIEGTLNANESLKTQIRLERELEAMQAKRAKQLQIIALISKISTAGIQALSGQTANIASSFQGFETGTEGTIDEVMKPNLKGVGKDNMLVRVHGKERIMNEALSSAVAPYSTSEVVKGFLSQKNGLRVSQPVIDTDRIVRAIQDNKVDYKVGEVVQGSFDIIRKEVNGNRVTNHIYRAKYK